MTLFRKIVCFWVFVVFCKNIMLAQCPQGEVVLETQAEVDNFAVLYPNCTEVDSLRIGTLIDSNSTDIMDLSSLSQITSIGDYLWIENNESLASLDGLENLNSVGALLILGNATLVDLSSLGNLSLIPGLLAISTNNALTSLSGLGNITSIGAIDIHHNDALTSLYGLDSLTSVHSIVRILENSNLINLNGLSNLVSIGGIVEIEHNANLTSLSGLDNLISIGGFLRISDNDSLATLSGLANLASIEEDLGIHRNDNLMNLTGLGNLASMRFLSITNNNNLSSLEGLNQLNTEGGLHIAGNPTLSICAIPPICDYLESGVTAEIGNNSYGCNSSEEVLSFCTVPTTTPDALPQITISPNPTKGTFTIQNIPNGIYQIHNTSGQIIQEGNMQSDLLIDISHEAQGVYFISITMDNETSVRRMVKM